MFLFMIQVSELYCRTNSTVALKNHTLILLFMLNFRIFFILLHADQAKTFLILKSCSELATQFEVLYFLQKFSFCRLDGDIIWLGICLFSIDMKNNSRLFNLGFG